MDLTVVEEIGKEAETGKGGTGIMIGTTTGTLVGIIIVIITGMAEDGVIRIVTGTVNNTTLVTVESTAAHVNTTTATVLRTSQEGIQPGDSVTTRLLFGLGFSSRVIS